MPVYPGSFRFLNSTMTVTESAVDLVRIPVLWRNGTTASASVAFTITCGSACSPGDYVLQSPVPQILNWTRPSGSTAGAPLTQYITLSIPDDGLYEQPETFTIRLALVDRKVDDTVGVGKIGSIGEMVITIAGPNNGRLVDKYCIGRRSSYCECSQCALGRFNSRRIASPTVLARSMKFKTAAWRE